MKLESVTSSVVEKFHWLQKIQIILLQRNHLGNIYFSHADKLQQFIEIFRRYIKQKTITSNQPLNSELLF